jgi:hypothetical protein
MPKEELLQVSEAGLKNNATDRIAAAVARALAGAVPGVGSVLAEVISAAIPRQRVDRIEDFLIRLANQVDRLSAGNKLNNPADLPLIEEGVSQAARAFTSMRREYLARCVAHGVDADEQSKMAELKVLQLLGERGDDDLLVLDAVGDPNGWGKLAALRPPVLHVGATDEARARGELYQASLRKLVSVGALSFSVYSDERQPPQV